MSKTFKALVVGCALAVPALAICAAAADMKTAIETRQQNYKSLGKAFKAIYDELKKDSPDATVVKTNAEAMDKLAQQIPDWFPPGSGPETGIKTRAKAEIWSNTAEFTELAHKLDGEIVKLSQTAGSGDIAAARMQAQAVGQACKACHDKYRGPEEH